jgi:hypothetical protein
LGETDQFPTTGVPGVVVVGETNQSHTLVDFSSTENIVAPSGGQARIEAASGQPLNDVFIELQAGLTFNHLIFNPFNGEGPTTVKVTEDNGQESFFDYTLGNGNNFLTISAINGQRIDLVSISSTNGYEDLRQVRIGGISGVNAVPEPMSMGILAAGGLPLLGFLRRRRRSEEDEPAA